MSKTIFVTSTEPYSGKAIVAIGLVNMLLGKARKIGFFKPVITQREGRDAHIDTILSHFELPVAYEDSFAYTGNDVLQHMDKGNTGEILDTIIRKYKNLEEQYDFIVAEGTDYAGEGVAFEFELNAQIAKNLLAPVIVVVSGENKSTAQVVNGAITAIRNFSEREVQVLGIVANKVSPGQVKEVKELLANQVSPDIVQAVVPWDKSLQNPSMREVHEKLGGRLLFGTDQLNNRVDHFVTGAMQVPNFLNYLKDNVLIVTPGDRGDIIISALQANLSKNYPKVAGIVLTAGYQPDEPIIRLIDGLETVFPIITVDNGTFETSNKVGAIRSKINAGDMQKIQLAVETFNRNVDIAELDKRIITYQASGMTPRMFQYQITSWAKSRKKHIVLPEGYDERILKASARLISQDIVDLTILGDREKIAGILSRANISLDLDKVTVIDPAYSDRYEEYVNTLYELRKNKNVNLEMARDMMTDVSYFGTMMVYKGHADGMVSGAVHTTQHTIRPALQFVKTKPGISVVSSVFFMCLPDRVSVFGDCAVNPNPTAEQLAEIAISSAESSQRFGIEPRVAMLSYSSGTSGEGEEVEKVRRATEIVKSKRPGLKVEGPIQYDAAVDPVVGSSKMPGSEVAGQASVLIFPDLNTGNNTYKAVQRETGALAIGPMLQGLNKPVNDLSRGCTVDDVFNTVIITAIQCQDSAEAAP
ncbi:phosphate acetyltransferase [Hufsiella ginkgonis]|uniref:Phosphate acetyltransferase n=1 Tax=Hufsiella ginkgonis TaxID=2695274 RepID=A0A7K1Y2K0_9SPHI|nr:phosphate acetyltransferase [Hufsiella ginkgonis]MXV17227.1 phosphate acetyltransferase [Hufsiella ginkgonis]